MAWFAINITSVFLLESIWVSNFGSVIIVLSFMIVAFRVCLDQVCDAPKLVGPLTNHHHAENSRISGAPIPPCYVPFTGIHKFALNGHSGSIYLFSFKTCKIIIKNSPEVFSYTSLA